MFLDENIIRILNLLPEDADISNEYSLYALACLQSCSEAIVMYRLLEKVREEGFDKLSLEFEASIISDNDELNFDKAFEVVESLKELPLFNELYESYIDKINDKIIDDARQRDPKVIEFVQEYMDSVGSSIIMSYINTFIKPSTDEYQDKKIAVRIQKLEELENMD